MYLFFALSFPVCNKAHYGMKTTSLITSFILKVYDLFGQQPQVIDLSTTSDGSRRVAVNVFTLISIISFIYDFMNVNLTSKLKLVG